MVANANDAKSVDLSKHNRIILTQTFEDVNPGNKELLKFISANYPQKITTKFYLGITINVYSK